MHIPVLHSARTGHCFCSHSSPCIPTHFLHGPCPIRSRHVCISAAERHRALAHTLSRGLHLTAHGRTYGDGAALLHSPLPAAAAAGSPGHHLRFGHIYKIALLSPELLISIVASIGSPLWGIICYWKAHDVISYYPSFDMPRY